MFGLPRSAILWSLSGAIALFASACGQSRIEQCNNIIEIANQAVNEAKQLTNGGQTNDPEAMVQAADAMEQAAQDMEALELVDPELIEYRQGFIAMYEETSAATREFVEAFEQKDRPAAEAALSRLTRATRPEEELVQGINQYCTGGTGQ
ncbi:MAG: hypothetical protein SAJ12_00265 [Jaaginema sp. PMC 1079.18]|nr:hypothetical protein [Jaaginema sp. PMC 1080.18]MEC4849416.1 hypothetical protein [Jaaginema sp. PMC 1079.18]MEC4864952.1 hypothetical protein [Jaaginema sp. PMC 1078.18]